MQSRCWKTTNVPDTSPLFQTSKLPALDKNLTIYLFRYLFRIWEKAGCTYNKGLCNKGLDKASAYVLYESLYIYKYVYVSAIYCDAIDLIWIISRIFVIRISFNIYFSYLTYTLCSFRMIINLIRSIWLLSILIIIIRIISKEEFENHKR